MIHEQLVSVGGFHLNLATGPAHGPPLLLLHGVSRRWQDWAPLWSALSPRWHVHALDLRGHGRSDRRPSRYFVADYVADVTALLRDRFNSPVVVYGHSLGALTALGAAAAAPERVRAIILEDPPAADLIAGIGRTPYDALFTGLRALSGRDEPVSEIARRLGALELPAADGGLTTLGRLRDPTSLRFSARCLQDLDPAVFDPLLAGRWLDGLAASAAPVRCPALLLRADPAAGGMLPDPATAALAATLTDCTRIDFPAVGHLIHWLEPEKTVCFVLGFLESL